MDIERKCEFNSITPEEIITYKFAATIKDKKAQEKLIKGPLKLQMVLETIASNKTITTANTETKRQTKNTENSSWKAHQVKTSRTYTSNTETEDSRNGEEKTAEP